ncbi:MAG: pyrophosphatase PpaX [Candidatus Izimaplasma sp.]|nr:pyrophosphatase PpaX [Candidatus Izimaplasma bacterium]
MKNLDTILFDLDGTLINTNEIIIRSFISSFKRHFPDLLLSREKIMTFIGPTLHDTYSQYTNSQKLVEEMISSYREFYVQYEVGNFEIYPQVEEVISDLYKLGYNLGIVTSKFKVAAWPSFTFYGLEKYFSVFIALDDVIKPKPNKEPIIKALSRFPSHNKAIMIGDNQGDIRAGRNAGIYCAGVDWSLKGHDYLMEVNPDFMLKDMKDIYRIISLIDEE